MTPWAELLVRPSDDDLTIRKRFHILIADQHPDRDGADGEPGARWYDLTRAYSAIKTEDARTAWLATRAKLARLCQDCNSLGVKIRRLGKDKGISVCAICGGEGRRMKR